MNTLETITAIICIVTLSVIWIVLTLHENKIAKEKNKKFDEMYEIIKKGEKNEKKDNNNINDNNNIIINNN